MGTGVQRYRHKSAYFFLAASLFFLSNAYSKTSSPPYQPQALADILKDVESWDYSKGSRPILLFDLDDTLFSASSRNARIVHEFAGLGVLDSLPTLKRRLEHASLRDMWYDPADTLKQLGVQDDGLLSQYAAFWESRFFSDAYCAMDEVIPGAPSYVRRAHAAGAQIVYLTGRPEGRMGKGTREALKRWGFPMQERTKLYLKPDPKMKDIDFKKQVFAEIETSGIGPVIAAFENEPRNLNAMGAAFSCAMIFVDSRHSSAPDRPAPQASWIENFDLP